MRAKTLSIGVLLATAGSLSLMVGCGPSQHGSVSEGNSVRVASAPEQRREQFWQAIKEGDVPAVESLLDAGIDLTATNPQGQTALIAAVVEGQNAMVRMLIQRGADPCVQAPSKMAAWTAAIVSGTNAVATLIGGGADVNREVAIDPVTATPLMVAAGLRQTEVVKLLVAHGGDLKLAGSETLAIETLLRGKVGSEDVLNALGLRESKSTMDRAMAALDSPAFKERVMAAEMERDSMDIAAEVESALIEALSLDGTKDLGPARTAIHKMLAVAEDPARLDMARRQLERALARAQSATRSSRPSVPSPEASEADANYGKLMKEIDAQVEKLKQECRSGATVGPELRPMMHKGGDMTQGSGIAERRPSLDSTKVTRAEWRRQIAPYDTGSLRFQSQILTEAGFKMRFGKPKQTQRVGDKAYWYYGCSDGTIQIVIEAVFLDQQGVVIDSINEL